MVVKSLGGNLGVIPGISGGAILGDGRVGLILDVVGLVAAGPYQAAARAATPGDADAGRLSHVRSRSSDSQ